MVTLIGSTAARMTMLINFSLWVGWLIYYGAKQGQGHHITPHQTPHKISILNPELFPFLWFDWFDYKSLCKCG